MHTNNGYKINLNLQFFFIIPLKNELRVHTLVRFIVLKNLYKDSKLCILFLSIIKDAHGSTMYLVITRG